MDAPATNTKIAIPADVIRLVGIAMLTLFGSLLGISLLVMWRRAAGELRVDTDWSLLAYALALPLAAFASRHALIRPLPRLPAALLLTLPTLALLSFAFALTNHRALWLTLFVWLMVLTEEGCWWYSWLRPHGWRWGDERMPAGAVSIQRGPAEMGPNAIAPNAVTPNAVTPNAVTPSQHVSLAVEAAEPTASEEELETTLGPQTTQLMERTESNSGECISGQLRVRFAAAEQIRDLHVAFCPPLATPPQADLWYLSGVECSIKLVEVCTYGVHAEVRRSRPLDTAAEVVLQLIATENQGDSDDEVGR